MAHQCNFNVASEESTGSYRLRTTIYCFTDMPVEFQKAMESTLVRLKNTDRFLVQIIVVSAGTVMDQIEFCDLDIGGN